MKSILTDPRVKKVLSKKRTLHFKNVTKDYDVYEIPLDLLYFNDENDRIATSTSQYNATHVGGLKSLDKENLNNELQKFIIESGEKEIEITTKDILKKGQLVPGVVLTDGRIIDGNRRFTCLRLLNTKYNETFPTFLAVILDDNNDRDIKELELWLQYEDKVVQYDPINRLVGVYNNIIKNKQYTPEQYAKITHLDENDVKKMVKKAELMVDFLDAIDAPGAFYIAKELKLDGQLDEIYKKLKKLTDNKEKWKKAKVILNDMMMLTDSGDKSRNFRVFIENNIINNKNFNQFYDEFEQLSDEMHDKIEEEKSKGKEITLDFIKNNIRGDKELNHKVKELVDDYDHDSRVEQTQDSPTELLRKFNKELNKLDKGIVGTLKGEKLNKFKIEFDALKKHVDEFNDIIDND